MFVTTKAGETLGLSGENAKFLGQPPPNNGDVVVYQSADGKARFGAITATMLTTGFSSPPPIGNTAANTGAFTTLSATGTVDFAAGSVGTPSLRFGGDTTTGFYKPAAANQLNFSAGGIAILNLAGTGISSVVPLVFAVGATTLVADFAGTSNNYIRVTDGTRQGYLQALSAGSIRVGSLTNHPVELMVNSGVQATFSTTGLAVTGAISATAANTGGHDINATSGARLQMFGGSHGSFPKQAYFDADTITFRTAAGGASGTWTAGTSLTVTGAFTTSTGFGCNSKTAQTAYASGGALNAYAAGANGLSAGADMSALVTLVANIRAALVANGVMS